MGPNIGIDIGIGYRISVYIGIGVISVTEYRSSPILLVLIPSSKVLVAFFYVFLASINAIVSSSFNSSTLALISSLVSESWRFYHLAQACARWQQVKMFRKSVCKTILLSLTRFYYVKYGFDRDMTETTIVKTAKPH